MKSRGIKLIAQKLCLFVWLSIQLMKMQQLLFKDMQI